MNCDDLSISNKRLFQELEMNSDQILFLYTRRKQLKKMINDNMESLNDMLTKQRNKEQEVEAEKFKTILNENNNGGCNGKRSNDQEEILGR